MRPMLDSQPAEEICDLQARDTVEMKVQADAYREKLRAYALEVEYFKFYA